MNKEQKAEKLFLSSLDALISRGNFASSTELDEDTISTLHFAEKIKALRCTPTAEYTAALKARLLQKLFQLESGNQKQVKRNWFSNLVAQPVWQATAIIIMLAVLTVAVWKAGVFQPGGTIITTSTSTTGTTTTGQTTVTTTATVMPAAIIAAGSTDKTVYGPGQSVAIDISLTNITSQPIDIAQFPPILSLMQTQTKEPVYTFISNETSKTLAPGETADYTYYWKQRDANDNQVPAGNYYVELEDINVQGNTVKLTFNQPVSFVIN